MQESNQWNPAPVSSDAPVMMNIQNPSFPQHPYSNGFPHGNFMAQPETMAQFPSNFPQSQQPGSTGPGGPSQFPQQLQGQLPPHVYQQLQQQQQHAQQSGGFGRPQSRENLALIQGQAQRQSPNNPINRPQSGISQGNAPGTPSSQRQVLGSMQQNMNMVQQSPGGPQPTQSNNMNSAAQIARNTSATQAPAPMNPQALAREEERVTTLLEINAHLLQEVTNLQSQGKAGSGGQQSPTSPIAGADNMNTGSNSPTDAQKRHPSSQEYADCMRRLQANLAYLAAIADANKKGTRPMGPAIMVPPPHLASVHALYQRLKNLFPEASQTTLNKAMAVANSQRAAAPVQAQAMN